MNTTTARNAIAALTTILEEASEQGDTTGADMIVDVVNGIASGHPAWGAMVDEDRFGIVIFVGADNKRAALMMRRNYVGDWMVNDGGRHSATEGRAASLIVGELLNHIALNLAD